MALEPGEQNTEDTHGRTVQVKMIKPVFWAGNYHFPLGKGYVRVEVVCSVRNPPNSEVW